MTITQTVEVPIDHRLIIEVPREVPAGRTILAFTPESPAGECPICAANRDPVTGEERFNAETIAVFEEVDAMLAGKIPSTLRRFNSVEEMWEDLMSDDPDDDGD